MLLRLAYFILRFDIPYMYTTNSYIFIYFIDVEFTYSAVHYMFIALSVFFFSKFFC